MLFENADRHDLYGSNSFILSWSLPLPVFSFFCLPPDESGQAPERNKEKRTTKPNASVHAYVYEVHEGFARMVARVSKKPFLRASFRVNEFHVS